MKFLGLILILLSNSSLASSYKNFICAGGDTIPKTPASLTPTLGTITSDLSVSKNFNVTLTGVAPLLYHRN